MWTAVVSFFTDIRSKVLVLYNYSTVEHDDRTVQEVKNIKIHENSKGLIKFCDGDVQYSSRMEYSTQKKLHTTVQ